MGTVFSSRFECNEQMRFAWRGTHANRWVIVSGSNKSGRSAGNCCFERAESDFYCLDMKAGMFRDGCEGYAICTNDHLLALDGCDLARGHPEALRNGNYLVLLDPKLIQHIRNRDGWFDLFFGAGKTYPRGEVLHNVSPVIRFVDVRVEALLFSEHGDPSEGHPSKLWRQVHEREFASPIAMFVAARDPQNNLHYAVTSCSARMAGLSSAD